MQFFNGEHMKHVDDYLIKSSMHSIRVSHLITSLEMRDVEMVTKQAHAVSQGCKSNPKVLMT